MGNDTITAEGQTIEPGTFKFDTNSSSYYFLNPFEFINITVERLIFTVVHQSYEPRVVDEDILRGNTAIVKCTIPSFVADYVHVVEWVMGEESLSAFSLNDPERNYGNRERPRVPNCSYPLYLKIPGSASLVQL